MIDPRREAVLILSREQQRWEDKTATVAGYESEGDSTWITFSSGKRYRYGSARLAVLRNPVQVSRAGGFRVEVSGTLWSDGVEALHFAGPGGGWYRLFYPTRAGEAYRLYPGSDVRIIEDAASSPRAGGVLSYWRRLVSALEKEDDPLRGSYDRLTHVHPDSVLGRYLAGDSLEPLVADGSEGVTIFPFSSNLSQDDAVSAALANSVSVIEGPPGTGKTQTILNIIANIVRTPGATVGVVSFNNAAVDNVREKLERNGYGHLVAGLGNKARVAEFFEGQAQRNDRVTAVVEGEAIPEPSAERLAQLSEQLRRLRAEERHRAQRVQEAAAYRVERRHFDEYFERHELPRLDRLPLLTKSSGRILDYLAEVEVSLGRDGRVRQAIRRVTDYFKYGSLRDIERGSTDVVLQLQRAYYDKKLSELERDIERVDETLDRANYQALAAEHQALSHQAFRAALYQRYSTQRRAVFEQGTYRTANQFRAFAAEYPVITSTCHSLRQNIPQGYLLDYLIIDEASQVNLLAAGLALSSCRNVIVVGDLKQLPHISDKKAVASAGEAPLPAYCYDEHNILSSLIALYGESLPSTMLREHYRCDPSIIGFCNTKFYGGQLVPFAPKNLVERPLMVVRTVEGNHMRWHRGGGTSNQREVDVIRDEVVAQYCADFPQSQIGVATPYRRQVGKLDDSLEREVTSDTVHKFQGREKDVIIMSTVVDETWQGKRGVSFVDDPQLVNVAVSRAVKRFVLVTNNDMMPTSRHLRDLVGYIRYHDPNAEVIDSSIVSVFDLLYRDYSARLRPFAARVKGPSRYLSENIMGTLLGDILAEPQYSVLTAVDQVLLRNLLPDLSRLAPEEAQYVKNRASVDFVVYNRVTNELACAIEVNGFAFHENKPDQVIRDERKKAICDAYNIQLVSVSTTGSGEEDHIRAALDAALGAAVGGGVAPPTWPGRA